MSLARSTSRLRRRSGACRRSVGCGRRHYRSRGRRGGWDSTRGIGYELVLNPVLPPLGEEVPELRASAFMRAVDGDDEDMRQLAEASRTSWARMKRKRRKKKVPKSSSSALLPGVDTDTV